MVMPRVPRKSLWMQDLACCDTFRTPVIFWALDIFVFVGAVCNLVGCYFLVFNRFLLKQASYKTTIAITTTGIRRRIIFRGYISLDTWTAYINNNSIFS